MSTQSRLKAALAAHYEVKKEIGAGGMATVFLARDVKHDRDVASSPGHRSYDVASDGRFLMVWSPPSAADQRIYVVDNWFSELRKKFKESSKR